MTPNYFFKNFIYFFGFFYIIKIFLLKGYSYLKFGYSFSFVLGVIYIQRLEMTVCNEIQ